MMKVKTKQLKIGDPCAFNDGVDKTLGIVVDIHNYPHKNTYDIKYKTTDLNIENVLPLKNNEELNVGSRCECYTDDIECAVVGTVVKVHKGKKTTYDVEYEATALEIDIEDIDFVK